VQEQLVIVQPRFPAVIGHCPHISTGNEEAASAALTAELDPGGANLSVSHLILEVSSSAPTQLFQDKKVARKTRARRQTEREHQCHENSRSMLSILMLCTRARGRVRVFLFSTTCITCICA
jgi:hypothetical protein